MIRHISHLPVVSFHEVGVKEKFPIFSDGCPSRLIILYEELRVAEVDEPFRADLVCEKEEAVLLPGAAQVEAILGGGLSVGELYDSTVPR